MTRQLKQAAESLCRGRLVICPEGGYSPAYVPFCGLAAYDDYPGLAFWDFETASDGAARLHEH